MSKTQACEKCFAPLDIPETIEVEHLLCRDCARKLYGDGYLDYLEKDAEDITTEDL